MGSARIAESPCLTGFNLLSITQHIGGDQHHLAAAADAEVFGIFFGIDTDLHAIRNHAAALNDAVF